MAGVVTLSPSTITSSPGGLVDTVNVPGGVPYSLATPSMSPADKEAPNPYPIPGGIVSTFLRSCP